MKKTQILCAAIVAFTCIAAACSSSNPSTPTPTPAAGDVTVNIIGINGSSSFNPNPTTIGVGQRVVWKNTDSTTHDIVQDANTFSTALIGGGTSASPVTMSTKGTFSYHCSIHPSMTGSITVQ